MDNIREWISDNLRYILLGLALVLVLAVAILGIRAITNIAGGGISSQPKQTEAETETDAADDTIVETNSQSDTAGSSLVQNDGKVLTTMTSYYSARTNGDTETLKKIDPSMDEQEQTNLTNSYVESYSNIKTYSKEGPTSGNYVVYVCYDGKVKDIDTLVPSLTQFYLKTNEEGSLYIADVSGDAQAEQFVEDTRKSSEVQNLIDEVAQKCEAAENSDPALKEFMQQYGNSQSSSDETQESQNTEMVATDECNVRAEANTDCEVYDTLTIGQTVTVIAQRDDGWTEIDYNGQSAYVSSEFLATPEAAQSEAEAEYFAPAASDDGSGTDDGSYDDGSYSDQGTYDDGTAY
ncbi:MAG: SH3 domain-containing protein [Eubacteriales bacterium]|nr:SH3 domain-containing protein [Eubacteriales bacterium]